MIRHYLFFFFSELHTNFAGKSGVLFWLLGATILIMLKYMMHVINIKKKCEEDVLVTEEITANLPPVFLQQPANQQKCDIII